jgi:plastocyanin
MTEKERQQMRKSVSAKVFLAAFGLGIAGLAAMTANVTAQPQPETMEVKIDNFTFGPAELAVPAGTTITWTNRDDIPHTVVSSDKVFKSKVLDTDEKFSSTFRTPGTFAYFCSIHPKMTGRVVVQ